MWKNVVEPNRPLDDTIMRRMRFACWINKSTHTGARQKCFRESASVLLYTYTASFFVIMFKIKQPKTLFHEADYLLFKPATKYASCIWARKV